MKSDAPNYERYVQDMLQGISKHGLTVAASRDNMGELTSFSEVLNQVVDRYPDQVTLPVLAGKVAILLRKPGNPAKPHW